MRTIQIASIAALLAAAACDAPAATAENAENVEVAEAAVTTAAATDHHAGNELTGQVFSAETDVGGYYMPNEDVAIGDIHLDHISVGLDWEFESYAAGDPDAFAPLRLHFEDRSSPTGVNELGGTYYEVNHRFEPENFLVTDTSLAFNGSHNVLGDIRFEGTFDPEQVAAMQNGDPQLAETALVGTLHVGDSVFENVTFQGWLGD